MLHIALRNLGGKPILVDGKNVMDDVNDVLSKMEKSSAPVTGGFNFTWSLPAVVCKLGNIFSVKATSLNVTG